MILKYNESAGTYFLDVPRTDIRQVSSLKMKHGFDVSRSASSSKNITLFTKCPYAAVQFYNEATPGAQSNLEVLYNTIQKSWAQDEKTAPKYAAPEGKTLWPFQAHAVQYALERQHTLIGDQPGLGKTPTAIVFANELKAKNILVVCPANIRLQWAKQVRAWSTMRGWIPIHIILSRASGVHPDAAWTIVSYDMARNARFQEVLTQRHYDLLILDEGHYLKNSSAGRTRAVFGPGALADCSERILALTGTPLPNRPKECFTLTKGLCHDAIDWMGEVAFSQRFNPKMKFREEKGRFYELQNRLRANFMVRRLKKDVLPQLPEIIYEISHIEENTGDIAKALEAEKLLDIDPDDLTGIDAEILGHISVVRKMMGVAKAPEVADYVEMVMQGGEDKLFLVGWHIEVLDILETALSKWGLVRIDGSVPPMKRQARVDGFIKDPSVRICLGNMQAVGTGTDGLQDVSKHIILAEPSWVPGDIQQCIDRLHRFGQQEGVLAEFLVVPGSLDERVIGSAIRKMQDIHSSLDEKVFLDM